MVDSKGSNSNQEQQSCEVDKLTVGETKSKNRKSTKTGDKQGWLSL